MRISLFSSAIATSVALLSTTLINTAHAQVNLTVTGVGQYGGGQGNVVDKANGGVYIYLSGPVTNVCAAGGNFVANRLDIPGAHSRRKDILNMATLALVIGRTVNVASDACITIDGYKIPAISDAASAQGYFQIN